MVRLLRRTVMLVAPATFFVAVGVSVVNAAVVEVPPALAAKGAIHGSHASAVAQVRQAAASGALTALPSSATDATKVPHYFGPWPNWANSPLTRSTAEVVVSDTGGSGTGATAEATIDPLTGTVSEVVVTAPGHDYVSPKVTVTGGSAPAAASATVTTSGGVTAYAVGSGGHGYSSFAVTQTGGGGTGATAEATGGVDAVDVGDGGAGYTAPTVEFALPDDPTGTQAKGHVATVDRDGVDGLVSGRVTKVVVDDPGSGYASAPDVAIHNGTLYDPIAGATAPAGMKTTLTLQAIAPKALGTGYTSAPALAVTDPSGSGAGATATATVDVGAISAVTVTDPGAGFLTQGIKKFQDQLPLACDPVPTPAAGGCPEGDATTKFIPLGAPETRTYGGVESDQYTIGLVQYRTRFSSDLPPTLVRGYVQVETPANASYSEHYPLTNELLDGTTVPVKDTHGDQVYGVTSPQWMGPFLQATKGRAVRVIFHNYLPTGKDGDLFLPVDPSMMGSGMGPMANMSDPVDQKSVLDDIRNPLCAQVPKDTSCFSDNRAMLHLHGGTTPWISDGTPHQWITPAGQQTDWPQGVSVSNVPDMADAGCDAKDDGCQTFYYTNEQSARLMFYHDHSWGITRLNVYAGEAAGYSITDPTEQKLVDSGTIPAAADTIPLIVQDRTFVPGDEQTFDTKNADGSLKTYGQDPTWDAKRWGGKGSFWYHHVYMTAQNPDDPTGMSAYGRWMYGPWFWPPATGTKYAPIDNPYYDPACRIDDPKTWQYQTDPYCEPKQIPGTPNVSAGMEQFNDTPVVNGVAYPTVTLQPKSYRLRMLNAANDRFFNFQWYVADPTQGNGKTEVALDPQELAAAQLDPNVSPTPVQSAATEGPDWVQIGSEGGFLPAPAVIDGQQPTTWITDPTRFDVGNVDKHSMLLAPAERSDVIVDFSKYAGKTLILYNDAPAAFPARVSSYDYYTGAPDLSPVGAPKILPGYGPNTRTVMQVTIAPNAPAPAFDLTRLKNAFKHTLTGTGVFESGQHPVIVGQAAYNSAYGSGFASAGNCSVGTLQRCDGYVRINDTAKLNFNTLRSQTTRVSLPLQPKAIHDEMNSSTFDEFGRMQANLGVEASPPTPGAQNVTLYPYVNPGTEFIDGTQLPQGMSATPISNMADGTQLWRITHNGVDTHPIHFHLFDVQLLNRVTWDNIIIPPDENELGWKDTVRVSPLEDTIVALRPIVPTVPFEVPNSVRPLNPMMDSSSTAMFNNVDVQGNPTAAIVNKVVNFGWEYVYHCHILSHEEMDMMRPVTLALPPLKPDGLVKGNAGGGLSLTFNDNSITETSFVVQRSSDGTTWTDVATSASPLDQPNRHEVRTVALPAEPTSATGWQYRVQAKNTVGYGGAFPSMTVSSTSVVLTDALPVAPSGLTAAQDLTAPGHLGVTLAWTDNATNETGFVVERSEDGGVTWQQLGAALPADTTSTTDLTVARGTPYSYRVSAVNAAGRATSNVATITLVAAPTNLTATDAGAGVGLAWSDAATNETGFVVDRSVDGGTTWTRLTATALQPSAGAGAQVSWTDAAAPRGTDVSYRVGAVNGGDTAWSNTAGISLVSAPTGLVLTPAAGAALDLAWTDTAPNETGFVVQRSTDGGATWGQVGAALAANTTASQDAGLTRGTTYTYRVGATSSTGATAWSSPATHTIVTAPTGLTPTVVAGPRVNLTWTDTATTETGYLVRRSADGGATWTAVGGVLLPNTTAASDTGVTEGVTYTYQVGAADGADTAWSANAATTVVNAPTGLRATPTARPLSIGLRWTDASAIETGFVVERSTDGGATWAQVGTRTRLAGTGATGTFTDTAVVLGPTYTYRVAALVATGRATSAPVSVPMVLPAVPTGVTGSATRVSATAENLLVGWNGTATATSYDVQWSRTGATVLGQVRVTAPSTSVTLRLPVRTYYVRVRATNALGTSAWSAWVPTSLPPVAAARMVRTLP